MSYDGPSFDEAVAAMRRFAGDAAITAEVFQQFAVANGALDQAPRPNDPEWLIIARLNRDLNERMGR